MDQTTIYIEQLLSIISLSCVIGNWSIPNSVVSCAIKYNALIDIYFILLRTTQDLLKIN